MSESGEQGSTGAERLADQAGDPTGPEDAGSRKEEATPEIGTEGNPGQTQTDAPADDAGGASDEESHTH
jgi:hypothetical protein